MAGRGRVSRCSLQRRPRRDGEEVHLGFEWLRAPLVRPTWLSELSAQQRAHRANWVLRARPGSKVRVALSAPLERLLEPGELRLREKDHANVDSYEHVQTLLLGLPLCGFPEPLGVTAHVGFPQRGTRCLGRGAGGFWHDTGVRHPCLISTEPRPRQIPRGICACSRPLLR